MSFLFSRSRRFLRCFSYDDLWHLGYDLQTHFNNKSWSTREDQELYLMFDRKNLSTPTNVLIVIPLNVN